MASSLDKLSLYLNESDLPTTMSFCKNINEFRYEELHLPSKSYGRLMNENIANNDYQHVLDVSNEFTIKTLGEYSDLYLRTDVLLLVDVFEKIV